MGMKLVHLLTRLFCLFALAWLACGLADDYTCGPDRPCKNKACCGPSNVCGYGELYCGKGCQSNCDATAECGRDAATPGQLCPLNICCSEFGFCGTTGDFCGTGCQSNCNDPDRPSPGLSGDVRNRVIGYYEAWRAEGASCGTMRPEEIPVEYLTQVNLAFVYIDPVHLVIIDMDEPLTRDLYARVADVKTRNPNIKVWLSVGGWTFNDPGPFQSVFTTLAANTDQVEFFATSLMGFMDRFGFDGVDLDWEYPGADDRGGRPEDVDNFPRMMDILKYHLQDHNQYSKKFGLSITVPTSYWYLRWFDLSALEPYVDEFNLMAYDLHGTWDELNPIGPHVLAHTNLTEIELALDLFWRNNVSPSKIVLGLAGKCTGAAGILSYREIQEMVRENNLDPYYDAAAGVYYVAYGDGGANWVSFDDDISFQAKIDLANKYGLRGVLIWAIDQDSYEHGALQSVVGKAVTPTSQAIDGYGAFSLDQCYITECEGTCNEGDVMMTWVTADESGQTFCCPAVNAPDASTCTWRGAASCRGKCLPGEVTMLYDDITGECAGMGGGAWCCPATNGEEAISKCQLQTIGKPCPSDRRQELTSIVAYENPGGDYTRKYCCPSEPEFKNCAWHGDEGTCANNGCPAGQVYMYDWNGAHAGPPADFPGCNVLGDRSSFCCDPPLSGGSPFFPVPLENLFPDADSFPTDYSPTFAMGFDSHADQLAQSAPGQQPNKEPFVWIVLVGEEEDLHSFDKRDGSDLDLFDCPQPAEDDFSTQKIRAVCSNSDASSSNCLDIEKGGTEGTVVRLPSDCGPDRYVRAVRFEESTNRTLPGHLQKRYSSDAKIYDFHYDYDFKNLRRDGGEIYFRADLSTHPGYWDEIVAAPVKRSGATWRELDRRWLAEVDPAAWLAHFKKVFGETPDEAAAEKRGLKKHYDFHRCLFEASATCAGNPSYNVTAEAHVYGEFNTTMDLGMTLIGTLRNFDFSEAFASFAQHDLSVRIGAALRARALLHFDTGWNPMGPFDVFGLNMNLKGIFTIDPYFQLDVRLEAQAYVSAQATVEMTLQHKGFRYYLPRSLEDDITEGLGDYNLQGSPGPIIGHGDIEARVGGGLIFHFRPTVGVDVKLHFASEDYVDTSIKLTTDAQLRFDLALSTRCQDGLQTDVAGSMAMDLSIEGALPGWKDGPTNLFAFGHKSLFSDCIPFAVLLGRGLQERATLPPIPHTDTATCAASVSGVYCANPDGNDDTDPECDLRKKNKRDSGLRKRNMTLDDGEDEDQPYGNITQIDGLRKRTTKKLLYCATPPKVEPEFQGFEGDDRGLIQFPDNPSSSELVRLIPNVVTYDAADMTDCRNFDLAIIQTPSNPYPRTGRKYETEHILEGQTLARFFKYYAESWSDKVRKQKGTNPAARWFTSPSKDDQGEVTWCRYMKRWWGVEPNKNTELATAFPSNKQHTEEWVLLEQTLNGQVKQNWFHNVASYHTGTIERDIQNRKWGRVAETFKLQILWWKYYSDYESNRKILAKQARRVEEKLEQIEGTGPDSIQATVNTYPGKSYEPQGLTPLWRKWVRDEHSRVQTEAKAWLEEWVKKAYDMNRPPSADGSRPAQGISIQLNEDIVEIFEIAWKEVQALKDWDIPWDYTDDDEMDLD
ncbi:hypothetical protein BJX61DRAFT_553090 [Aspergillus egyptiacus]|nr:hypothetical protein BJX61DRAFT_553090 [Aspergillus egyptiacus]